ncbi:hypothetical protein GCM10010210_13070 [Pseudonocardia hydrocarbonoxydans]|uniref:HNH nuclease domain-containing protein n=1 Tax=Pseudonocardia hydrocarbonoxydans TaxID=76726 RepID=A0A4Y3WQE5_9PSEU|nr:hypothetical protein PHY01_32770 [Pseudonocardia hydrocarbonoxydans]
MTRTNMRRLPGQVCVTGCGRKVHARGYCHSCYKQHAPRKPCKSPGCSGRHHAQGLCARCYEAARARADIGVVRPVGRSAADRFAERVTPGYESCQLWTGPLDINGCASFTPSGGRAWRAHRWAYAVRHGAEPRDSDGRAIPLDHHCRVRHCTNPDHLEPVSHRTNSHRGRVAAGARPITENDTKWFFTALAAWCAGADNFPTSVVTVED